MMKVSAIVPAYNERERIAAVLDAIKSARTIDDIVVVSDGSTDGTYELAAADPAVRALKLEANGGKAGAMRAGALGTDADLILFLDADLIGLDGPKVDALVAPVAEDRADMAIGVFRRGRGLTDLAQLIAPYISGQRAMRRELFLSIPGIEDVRSGVEMAITRYCRARRLRVERVDLPGCTHVMKEEKLGLVRGVASRLRMYVDITKIILDGHAFRE